MGVEQNYLERKGYTKDNIIKVINKLVEKKLLNDEYYAKCYITNQINRQLTDCHILCNMCHCYIFATKDRAGNTATRPIRLFTIYFALNLSEVSIDHVVFRSCI